MATSLSARAATTLWCSLIVAAIAVTGCGNSTHQAAGQAEQGAAQDSETSSESETGNACNEEWGENRSTMDLANQYITDDLATGPQISQDQPELSSQAREVFVSSTASMIGEWVEATPAGGQQRFLDRACASGMLVAPGGEQTTAEIQNGVRQDLGDSAKVNEQLQRIENSRYMASIVLYNAYSGCGNLQANPDLSTLKYWNGTESLHYTDEQLEYFRNIRENLCP